MQERKHLTATQKTQILRDLLENQESISVVSEKYGVHPNDIYRWKKQLFEGAPVLLANKNKGRKNLQKENEKIKKLEEKLKYKDQVISELAQENMSIKKSFSGED
jgi:transposase-like protein